jgi:hypothetical protein
MDLGKELFVGQIVLRCRREERFLCQEHLALGKDTDSGSAGKGDGRGEMAKWAREE